jgi:hypothetical protein
MAGGINREELRKLVRDVLRATLSAIPEKSSEQPQNLLDAMRQAALPGGSGIVAVTEDLSSFAQMVVQAASHEDLKVAIMSGRLKFELGKAFQSKPRSSENPVHSGKAFTIDHGMLSETRIAEIGKTHTKIVLGREVVVTPLARDRARELKLELVRSKS